MTRLFRARCLAALALAIAVAWLAPPAASAQQLYGSIVGTVVDAQGAATPGVAVSATNTGTGLKVEAVTDTGGGYVLRNLLPGTYDLTANLPGFKEHTERAIPVQAGNPVRIDVKLEVGVLTENIEVVSETTLLNTEKADLSSQISGTAITNLPLNQFRNYQTLLNLVPGATPTQYQNAEIDTPGRSLRTWVNGTQPNSNTTRVDGAASVNVWLPHHAMYVQSAESIETVNISTNNFDADTGMAAGAAQTVITKSGTNELKGSAFLFLNKDAFNTNTYFNDYFGLPKPGVDTKTFGGTVGGPVKKNKLFYFGSWERYDTQRPTTYTYTVPTAKMRAGDFSEVAAAYPAFKLFNPFSGTAGTGREQWTDNKIPSQFLSPITQGLMAQFFPAVNSTQDLNSNLLLDDYSQIRNEYQKRDNVDVKMNWQVKPSMTIWGKYGEMKNKGSGNNFYLGFDNPSVGDTRVILSTFGTTWTLSKDTVIDGNFGMSRQDQTVLPADFGTNYGIQFGIPGTNNPNDIRESGLPVFASTYTIGTGNANWMPLYRKEINYSGTLAMTKMLSKHEIRAGFDFVRYELNHRQAEWGDYGLKGGFSFSNNTTGAVGYTSPGWNSFAALLMGLPNYYAEDTQTETMTGRENQLAWYVRDRWNLGDKLTLNGGLRLDYYPLMNRVGRGIERLDYNTYTVILGGIGGQPDNAGINYKAWYVEPRVGAAYRLNQNTVFRAGYGQTKNPLPWSRPMRGSYPFDINNNRTAPGTYDYVTTLAQGIPLVTLPDTSSGTVTLPSGVFIRSPNPDDVNRGTVHQWNVTFERRLPLRMAADISYVGTATNGGYADLNVNVGVPGGGGSAAKYFAVAGTTAINDWASRTKARYRGLQMALNRPFRDGFMIKGAYTWSQSKDMADEDGWTGVTWNYLPKFDDNFALSGFDRTHVFQIGWVYELPFFKNARSATGALLGGWQINGVAAAFSGTPFSIGGTNNAMACQGCGSININYNGSDPNVTGSPDPGKFTSTLYDKSLFAQPTGLDVAGFGNTARNFFRRPAQSNVDLSFFKAFPLGRYRPEFRLEVANLFNQRNWGAPNTSFTSPLFLTWSPSSVDTTATLGYRRMQLGFRFQF
jgi:hypothetical protein